MNRSSVITPTRGRGDDLEIFWSQRRHDLSFIGGYWAFAGGSVEAEDASAPVAGSGPAQREAIACAARELFEEMGIWICEGGARHVSEDPVLARLHDELESPADFVAALRSRGETIAADRFVHIGHWRTPEWFEIGTDSEFFALALTGPENERFGAALADSLQASELIRGEWVAPHRALRSWLAGEKFITPPIRLILEAFDVAHSVDDVDVQSPGDFHYDLWRTTGGIFVVPLRTPTLPPATHTNCIIVGEERFVVIDPGSPDEGEQALLHRLVQEMLDDGRELVAAVLTHHHVDHVAGVAAFRERFDAPAWAHRLTAEHLDVDRHLRDGERLDLGVDSLECLFTPGHASGHLAFFHERTNGVIAGDLIASRGTILVNPPDGHMGDYLESLRRVRALEPTALHPAHGFVITNPAERLAFYESHRMQREEKVFAALAALDEPAAPIDVVPEAYADTPQAIWPLAARSAEAHLVHLVEIGRARRVGERYVAAP